MKHIRSFGRGQRRGCKRRGFGCFFLLLLLAVLFCGGLFWLIGPRSVEAADDAEPLAVWLLIDNSNSMFEKDGVGSDPELLRIDAARLFISYLGVDERDLTHQTAVIFFGSEAETAVPPTPLTNDSQRSQLFSQISQPIRMGWTDHLAALALAQAQQSELAMPHRPVIVLLTDGKPENRRATQANTVTELQAKSEELAAADIPLFIILLANEATDSDPEIAAIWQPLWQEMSEATTLGQFFVAREAADLPTIYHDVVVALTESQSEGIVLQTAVSSTIHEAPLIIPPHLTQLTLVIGKENPSQTITLTTADGVPIEINNGTIRRAGGDGLTREEIWVVENPPAGEWLIQIEGAGVVTVWQDSKRLAQPAATAVKTAPTSPTVFSRTRGQAVATIAPTSDATAAATQSPATATLSPTESPTPLSIIDLLPTATAGETAVPATTLTKPDATAARTHFSLPWLLSGLALLGVVTAGIYHRYHKPPPLVSGTLRLLDGARTGDGGSVIDLDSLNQTAITVGKPPADIPLSGAAAQAIIRPGTAVEDIFEMLISGNGVVNLNGLPVVHEVRLMDTAVIDLGGIKLRYENLRLRRAEREAVFGEQ